MTYTATGDGVGQLATYRRLIAFLDEGGASYRLIEHAAEGRTELVSALRGHSPAEAAKCVVVMVKLTKKTKRYVLAVVPGDGRVDLNKLKGLFGGSYAGFADNDIAERLAGSVSGTILPFAFDDELELIVDPGLTGHEEIFFNAARLDRSLALRSADYLRLAKPRLESIAQPGRA